MIRWLGVMLLLCLLCGCADTSLQTPAEPTQEQTEPATQVQTDPGIYVPESAVESQTGGAVKLYAMGLDDYTGILTMGEDLLLFEEGSLTLLTGDGLVEFTTVKIPGLPSPDSGLVQIQEDGVAYFEEDSKCIVFLGSNLRETMRLHLPEEMVGSAYLAPDWATVYYCTDSDIRVLDMKTGISRLLKEQGAAKQSITGVLLEGTVLRCSTQQTDGSTKTVLISTQTGEQLYEGDFLSGMFSGEKRYFLQVGDSSVPELLFGDTEGDVSCLWPAGDPVAYWVMPGCKTVVAVRAEDGAVVLDHYVLETGLRSASVRLEGLEEVHDFTASESGTVWFCSGEDLYRWDPEKSPAQDEAVYTQPRYLREQPDEEGLAAVQTAAAELEQLYQVELLLHSEAEGVAPWDYSFDTEYIPQAYHKALATLSSAMAQFPESFFTNAAERSANGKLTIVLVRGIYGTPEKGTLASAPGVQYWLDGKLYIALSMGQSLERYFYHEMGHVIDTVVLSKTKYFYEWEKLNPPEFEYDNDYITNQDRQDTQYLQDADRWFIDMYSMSFAVEDRSRIFEYACLPGNEAYFASETMQNKLQRVCTGIRRAFGLRNDPSTFLWEQYLQS